LSNERDARPRWFKIANPLTDVATQKAIVEELLGEACGLSEDVQLRQRDNYIVRNCYELPIAEQYFFLSFLIFDQDRDKRSSSIRRFILFMTARPIRV
jgi:hypothetical protein